MGLKKLYLPTMAEGYVEVSKLSEKSKQTYEQYLATLVELELNGKHRQKVERLTVAAKIPLRKSTESYDFNSRTGITAQEFARLSTGQFVREMGNVVFFGSYGMGKTHLASALTQSLCEAGFKCLFKTSHGLINELTLAKRDLSLTSLLKRLDRFDVIICDELGYVPHDPDGADLFFQLIAQRAERRSLVITTNLTFSEWEKVFINPRTTAAAVDRIILNCETFNICGVESWREAQAKKKLKTKEI